MTAAGAPVAGGGEARTLLEAALAAAGRGWFIFPVAPGGKAPAVRDWQARATTDQDRITRCWTSMPASRPGYNIGVARGPSGLLVLDLDVPKPAHPGDPDAEPPSEWAQPGIHDGADVLAAIAETSGEALPWDTYTVATGSGGTHLYHKQPDGAELRNTVGRLGWLIDTRGHGGYVVAAGSVVNGRIYTVLNDAPATRLPIWLADRLTAPEPPRAATNAAGSDLVAAVRRRSRYAAAALQRELDRVLAAPVGRRNVTLNEASYAIGQLTGAGLIPSELAEQALTRAGCAIDLDAREAAATVASGLAAGARSPRTTPA